MEIAGLSFREVWLVDYEFHAPPGERPEAICLVARKLGAKRLIRLWGDEIKRLDRPPYPIDEQVLFVAYYASAELNCHLALDWELPERVLDLFIEFRALTNGKELPCGPGRLGLVWSRQLWRCEKERHARACNPRRSMDPGRAVGAS